MTTPKKSQPSNGLFTDVLLFAHSSHALHVVVEVLPDVALVRLRGSSTRQPPLLAVPRSATVKPLSAEQVTFILSEAEQSSFDSAAGGQLTPVLMKGASFRFRDIEERIRFQEVFSNKNFFAERSKSASQLYFEVKEAQERRQLQRCQEAAAAAAERVRRQEAVLLRQELLLRDQHVESHFQSARREEMVRDAEARKVQLEMLAYSQQSYDQERKRAAEFREEKLKNLFFRDSNKAYPHPEGGQSLFDAFQRDLDSDRSQQRSAMEAELAACLSSSEVAAELRHSELNSKVSTVEDAMEQKRRALLQEIRHVLQNRAGSPSSPAGLQRTPRNGTESARDKVAQQNANPSPNPEAARVAHLNKIRQTLKEEEQRRREAAEIAKAKAIIEVSRLARLKEASEAASPKPDSGASPLTRVPVVAESPPPKPPVAETPPKPMTPAKAVVTPPPIAITVGATNTPTPEPKPTGATPVGVGVGQSTDSAQAGAGRSSPVPAPVPPNQDGGFAAGTGHQKRLHNPPPITLPQTPSEPEIQIISPTPKSVSDQPNIPGSFDSPKPNVVASPSSDWKEMKDEKTGRTYWYNKVTKKTTWNEADTKAPAPATVATPTATPQSLSPVAASPVAASDWKEMKDEKTGRPYWYNKVTKKTTWNEADTQVSAASPVAVASPAIQADASNDWKEMKDEKTGRPYWYNKVTKKTTWNEADTKATSPKQDTAADPAATPASPLPASQGMGSDWKEMKDEKTGRPYWYNKVTKKTTWNEADTKGQVSNPAASLTSATSDWKEMKDEKTGRPYWYNKVTKKSTWNEADTKK